LRFVVGADFDRVSRLEGPFRSSFRPEGDEDWVSEWQREELRAALAWFNEHLTVPPFRRQRLSRSAICWFRSDAGEALARMWDLAILLRQMDVPVRLVRTHKPGRLLWVDEHQVVAEAWRGGEKQKR
jgi:hypothetical protein